MHFPNPKSRTLNPDSLSGVLNFHKPSGITSARCVGRVKWLLPRGKKVGHAGTLDPFATGVLLILIGRATKSCESLMGATKEYEATLKLDATTPSLDPETAETAVGVATPPSREDLLAAMAKQIGTIEQMPPTFSALKINGRRAADRHRAGETVVLRPRAVRIDALDLIDYAWPVARVHVTCGRGTYVRAIARDLGTALGTGGYLTQLCRTRVGIFTTADAVSLDALTADNLPARLTPVDAIAIEAAE